MQMDIHPQYWINMGPLLYHYADAHTYLPPGEALSIEICLSDVLSAAKLIGFELLHSEMTPSTFNDNPRGMMHQVFHCSMFTFRKPLNAPGRNAIRGPEPASPSARRPRASNSI